MSEERSRDSRRNGREGSGGRMGRSSLVTAAFLATVLVALAAPLVWSQGSSGKAAPGDPAGEERRALHRPRAQAVAASEGCLDCHRGIESAHASPSVRIPCSGCHGGDDTARLPPGAEPGSSEYAAVETRAHVAPRFPEAWERADGSTSSANPVRPYTLTLKESREYIRFVNPGDLRVAQEACGSCHQRHVNALLKSPMTTTGIFWTAAGYANGIVGRKVSFLGESYGPDGEAQAILPGQPPTPEEQARGALPGLFPLPRWEITQPGEYFRAFERGGRLNPSLFPDIGNPNPKEEPGRPDIRLSDRGPGTGLRISPAVINLHKTRLNGPHLSFFGTNDHPGDYRGSGCSGCHLVYANDRDPVHSGPYAPFGHRGESASGDPALPRGESGHPIGHRLTRAIPTSQCLVCHMHQPNAFVNTYLGYTMWDYETDGEELWPEEQSYPSHEERRARLNANPEGAAVRGLWGDEDFLEKVSELNPRLQHTQLADYHGHGWIFRAVFSRDRKGNLLDSHGDVVPFDDPQRFAKAVHLKDIHLEKGMHCVDCHFSQDVHGNGLLYGEYGNAIEIGCEDCHGTVSRHTDLHTSGPAAPPGGTDLALGVTSFGRRRFVWRQGTLYQRSMVEPDKEWEVPQVKDTLDPSHRRYNEKARYAKTMQRDGRTWGFVPDDPGALAHRSAEMTCYTCHSSWVTSCFGCHLPQEANEHSPMLRYEGAVTRNYASYNPQVVRTDVFMLGVNGTVLGHRVAPIRSSSALVLSNTNINRKRIYIQQPPISAPGFSSQAFNPHVPHTVRTQETKRCSDCHPSVAGDNNAWLAQLLGLGTRWVSFIGRYAWVAAGSGGIEAVAVSEWDEPQAVRGSFLHRLAYPDDFRRHQERHGELEEVHHHPGGGEVLDVQLRGEYLFAATGAGGLRVFDVANVDNGDVSERIVTTPVSPLGQRTRVKSRYATSVALPSTMPMAFDRTPHPSNQEQPLHPLYRYAYVTDRYEGLILVDVATLTDREPRNNFLRRALTFNPDGYLDGAEAATVAGEYAYVLCRRGLVVVSLTDPLEPQIVGELAGLEGGTAVEVQLRYAFVTHRGGLAVVDVADPRQPRLAASLEIGPAHGLHVARTYAYVAAGEKGLVIVDVERPEAPRVDRVYDGEGHFRDVRDVTLGATNASLFAYVADAETGLHVLQLLSPETVPGYLGWSPRPDPRWIVGRHLEGAALAVSRGLERDRAVDESGNQVSIFNRVGARPFRRPEMDRLLLRESPAAAVSDQPPGAPQEGPVPSGEPPLRRSSGERPRRGGDEPAPESSGDSP